MDVDVYLERIGYTGPREPTIETLRGLHLAHLYTVPFENLDIHLGREIVLSLPLLYQKIVVNRRGGFCYELCSLFGWLLEQLGFQVDLLEARVYNGSQPGPPFDHMLLYLKQHRLIADVGFGDSFIEPLKLTGKTATQAGSHYRVIEAEGLMVLWRQKPDTEWQPQYCFELKPRQLVAFEERCGYQQTSPESSFTQKTVCSLAMDDGRITLANGRLIVTKLGTRREESIADEPAYRAILFHRFGIELEARDPVSRLVLTDPVDKPGSA